MEIFTPKAEVARREKLATLLSRIDDLLPQEDYVAAEKYLSYSLAPRIRLAAYGGDSSAQQVIDQFPAIKSADSVLVVFNDFSKKESSLDITAGGEGLYFCYDRKKFKVTNPSANGLIKVKKPDELFENLVTFIELDLSEGRKAWREKKPI